MVVSDELLDMLSCPECDGKFLDKDKFLVCRECKRKFPVEDGVPNLLI